MYCLIRGRWVPGYLDPCRSFPTELRLAPLLWVLLYGIDDQYFVRPKDARMLVNYLRAVGLRAVLAKVTSRLRERERNRKYLSVGIGRVLEGETGECGPGSTVLFCAYNHPRCASPVVVDGRFTAPWMGGAPPDPVVFVDGPGRFETPGALLAHAGWSPFSGIEPDARPLKEALSSLGDAIWGAYSNGDFPAQHLRVDDTVVAERTSAIEPRRAGSRLRGAIFGLGNYAKSVIMPNLDPALEVTCIHELDPLQLAPFRGKGLRLDTSPVPRPDERYDAYFSAGYHHTHADLAAEALRRGAGAVLEKPLATTREQLERLREAMARPGSGRLFSCFQRRYSPLNHLALQDLGVREGDAIHYYCIVYEVPLPARHWYRWPVSGSRILSNGCHWIDHYLFLNGYPPILHTNLAHAANGDVCVMLEAENGAVFSMLLTEQGSSRIGLRDYVELRAGDATVRITDATDYVSENTRRAIRRTRVSKLAPYDRMYRSISAALVAGEKGDSGMSLRSTEVALDLDEMIRGGGFRR